jgi:phosphoribosylanthranilate isomerase
VRIKICGITNLEDALIAVGAGADALGFVFAAGSPRRVTPDTAARIAGRLPPFVARVGVFVNESAEKVRETAALCGLDTLQFHGCETPAFCREFAPLKVCKAFRVESAASLESLPDYPVDAWLLDSFVPGQAGGTGAVFNWDLAAAAQRHGRPLVLAGGLTPGNVAQAIEQVRPYAVDVSSGVEAAPGRKDPARVIAFCEAVRRSEPGA